MDAMQILDEIEKLFPDAACELVHRNAFELLCAVILSAQATDESVNKVTPALFAAYPDAFSMAAADPQDVAKTIRSIGLYRNKSKHLVAMSRVLVQRYEGEVPRTRKALMELPGVGRKSANVVLSVAYDIPALAVDTHVERISKRLGLAKFTDDVEQVEVKLKRKIKRERWNKAHHLFIFFGRYLCTAKNPHCLDCPFGAICKKDAYDEYKKTKK